MTLTQFTIFQLRSQHGKTSYFIYIILALTDSKEVIRLGRLDVFFESCISFSNSETILLEYESLEISFIFLSVNVIAYSTNITSSGGPYDQGTGWAI